MIYKNDERPHRSVSWKPNLFTENWNGNKAGQARLVPWIVVQITEQWNLNSHYGIIHTNMNHISVGYYTQSSSTISYHISRALKRSSQVHSFVAVLKTVKKKKKDHSKQFWIKKDIKVTGHYQPPQLKNNSGLRYTPEKDVHLSLPAAGCQVWLNIHVSTHLECTPPDS